VGDVRIDEPVLTLLSGLQDRHDRRLVKSAVLGGVGATVRALRSGTGEAVADLARPWDVPNLVEEAVRVPAAAFDDVVVVLLRPSGIREVRGRGRSDQRAWRASSPTAVASTRRLSRRWSVSAVKSMS
jgi:hypothetical protein